MVVVRDWVGAGDFYGKQATNESLIRRRSEEFERWKRVQESALGGCEV